MRNFGGNVCFEPSLICTPRSADEVLAILQENAGKKIRCIGSLHSWSPLVGENGIIAVDLRHFDEVHLIGSSAQRRVQVGAGCTIGKLLDELRRHGRTLPTVGAILKQTIAGAVATGTHGSGASSLSHLVDGVRLATYDASGKPCIVTIQDGDELLAARCSLGFVGIVLSLVLRTDPLYNVEERFEETRSRDEVLQAVNAWPLQQFAWIPWRWSYIVWRRRRTRRSGHWLWRYVLRARVFLWNDLLLHWFLWLYVRLRSAQQIKAFFRSTSPASYPDRVDDSQAILTLRHDLVRHVEMELFLPEAEVRGGMDTLRALVEEWDHKGVWTHHYPISFRRVDLDDTLISMASPDGAGTAAWYAVSLFTYLPVGRGFDRFAQAVAERMVAKHRARLHWGKYFPLSFAQASRQYPHFALFEGICRGHDPNGTFQAERLVKLQLQPDASKMSAAAATPRSSG